MALIILDLIVVAFFSAITIRFPQLSTVLAVLFWAVVLGYDIAEQKRIKDINDAI